MCFKLFKKTMSICLIGFGIGILLSLILPLTWWLFIFGVAIVIAGFVCIC